MCGGPQRTVLAERQVNALDLKEDIPQEASGKYPLRIEWSGFLDPLETGDYTVGVRLQGGFARIEVDGKALAHGWVVTAMKPHRCEPDTFISSRGKKVYLKVTYGQGSAEARVKAQLIWSKFDPRPSPEAIQAAENADVVVAVLGITSELEGEEMPVSEEGFKGGSDRTSIDLPKPEAQLLEAVAAAEQTRGSRAGERQRPRRELGQPTRQRHSRIPGMPAKRAAPPSRKRSPARTIPRAAYPSPSTLESTSCRPSKTTP